jgi:hypothetical protein
MTYRDDRAAHAQRIADLEARLSGIRSARASLSTLESEEKSLLTELDTLRKRSAPTADDLRRRLPMLDRIEIASPCSVPWDSMQGDGRKRFCGDCKQHVYNVAAMTRAEAEELLACEGSVCLRLFRRADGTVLTADCPVGLRRKRRRRLAAVVIAGSTTAAAMLGALQMFHARAERVDHSAAKSPIEWPIQGGAVAPPIPDDPFQGQAVVPQDDRPVHRHVGRARPMPPAHSGAREVVGLGG